MNNKKLATVLLLILPIFLTACSLSELPVIGKFFGSSGGGGGLLPNEPVTLNFWGLFEEPEVIDALIAKYQEANPQVTINYDDRSIVGADDYKSALFSRAAQDGAPDLAMVHSSWVRSLQGSLTPSNNISGSDYASMFYPVAAQDALVNGSIYAAPLGYDGLALVYNKSHFSEIDQATPPTSWEEFMTLAVRLTRYGERGEIIRGGAALGTSYNIDFSSDILALMLYQSGVLMPFDPRVPGLLAGLAAEDSPYSLDSKPAYDVLTFYTNFITENRVWSEDLPESAAAFAQERVSMIFVPSWAVLDILRERPDLQIGVAPVPQALVDPEDSVNLASYWMIASPSGSKNSAVAWDFIKFLSQEDTQLAFFNESSNYREFGRPYSSPNLFSEVVPGSVLDSYLKMAPMSRSSLMSARSGNKNFSDILDAAINDVLYNEVSSMDAMRTAKAKIEELR